MAAERRQFMMANEAQRSTVDRGASVDRASLVVIIAILSFVSLLVADRALMPAIPVNVDPASYAVVAHELLNGERLYQDIWDHKPPAPFIVYALAELAFGYTPQTLYTLNLVVCIALMLMMYALGSRSFGGRPAGLIAAGMWMLTCGSFGLEGRDPNTEILINASVAAALVLMLDESPTGWTMPRSIAIGFFLLLATMFKPVLVVMAVLLSIAHIATSDNVRRAVRDTAIVGVTGVIGWAVTFAYFGATGRGQIFYDSMVAYNRHYSGGIVSNLIAPIRGNAELMFDVIGPLAVFAAIGFFVLAVFDKRRAAISIALVAGGWFAIASPGRFSVHYYQMWLPPLILTVAWAIGVMVARDIRALRFAGYGAAALLSITIILVQIGEYRQVLAGEFKPVLPALQRSEATAHTIDEMLLPSETFFLWGNTPNMYLLAGRRPPTAVLFESHLEPNPLYATLRARVESDLDAAKPELLVVEHGRPPVPDWIADRFSPTPIHDDDSGYAIYTHRDGRIANAR